MNNSLSNEMGGIAGSRQTLRVGKWSAWVSFFLFMIYDIVIVAGIAANGDLLGPYLTIAEALTIAGTPFLILLMAAIHNCAPKSAKVYSLTAQGWILLLTGFTVAVHFVNLTLFKQISVEQRKDYARFIGWEWPSMLYSIELIAWHMFFGLSVLFAAFAFRGNGKETIVRRGLFITGLLCIIGLIGPIVGNLNWRIVGLFGYGILFPIICVYIALVFKEARVIDMSQ